MQVPLVELMHEFETALDRYRLISATPIDGANCGRLAVAVGKGKRQGKVLCNFNSPNDFGVSVEFETALLGKDPVQYFSDTIQFLSESLADSKSRRRIITLDQGLII